MLNTMLINDPACRGRPMANCAQVHSSLGGQRGMTSARGSSPIPLAMMVARQLIAARLFLLLISLVLGGCSAVGPKFQAFGNVAPDKAELVVYRPDMFRAGGATLNLVIDGKRVGKLRNGGWLSVTVDSGDRLIELSAGTGSSMRPIIITLAFTPGQRRIFRVTPGEMRSVVIIGSSGFVSFGDWHFRELSEPEASRELVELRRSD